MRSLSIQSNSGFSLVEVMMSSLIMVFSIGVMGSFSINYSNLNRTATTKSKILQVKTSILIKLADKKSWNQTLLLANTINPTNQELHINPELSCVRDLTACTPGQYNLTVLNQDGSIFWDNFNSTSGFTRDGAICSSFGATNDSNFCNYKFNTSWSPICPASGPCVRPQIKVQIQLMTDQRAVASSDVTATALPIAQTNVLMVQPIFSPQVARNFSTYSNSSMYYANNLILNPLNFVTSPYPTELVPFTSSSSQFGGTINYISATQLSYTPAPGFYGIDTYTYTVRNKVTKQSARGTITVRVMTPYTWTGLAGVSDSTSSNLNNFCGKVVNGVCDGTTFPVSSYGTGNHVHMVFNDTCTQCNAILNGNTGPGVIAHTIEATSSYNGRITLTAGGTIVEGDGSWKKDVTLLISGGTFDASSSQNLILGNDKGWQYAPQIQKDYTLKIQGNGKFLSPANLSVQGGFYIQQASQFTHNNGNIFLSGSYTRNSNIYTPNVEFYNMTFGNGYGIYISSNFKIKNNAIFNPTSMDDKVTNGRDPVTWQWVVPAPKIAVEGNIILQGAGGSHCDGGGAGSCLGPMFELSGTGDQVIQGLNANGFQVNLANWNLLSNAPSIGINKTSGRTTMTGAVAVRRDFQILNIAAYDFTASKLIFDATDCGYLTFSPGPATEFNDLYDMTSQCSSLLDYKTAQINVRGNYYHLSSGYQNLVGTTLRSANLKLFGNFYISGSHEPDYFNRFIQVEFVGTGDQHIARYPNADGSVPDTARCTVHWLINKPSGTLFLDGHINTKADIIVQSGTLVASPNSVLIISDDAWNGIMTYIKAPNTVFESIEVRSYLNLQANTFTKNLVVGQINPYYQHLTTGAYSMYVANDLTLNQSVNAGNYNKIVLNGSGDQSMIIPDAIAGNTLQDYDIDINKTGGTVNFSGTGRLHNICVRSPSFTMNSSSNLTVENFGYSPGSLIQNGATLTASSFSGVAGCP